MCQIQFIMPLGRKIKTCDLHLMNEYLLEGTKRNDHAWGVTNGKNIFTRQGSYKEKYEKELKKFIGSDYLIGHNRLATQGDTIQPIKYKGWICIHNGILSGYSTTKNTKDSDTLLFLKDFVKSNKSIKEFMEDVDGSYSIFMINTETGEIFYFKNYSTDFYFYLIESEDKKDKMIVASTDKDNIENHIPERLSYGFLVPNYNILSSFEPDSTDIYSITKKKGVIYYDSYEYKSRGFNYSSQSENKSIAKFGDDSTKKAVNQLVGSKKNREFDHVNWKFKDNKEIEEFIEQHGSNKNWS